MKKIGLIFGLVLVSLSAAAENSVAVHWKLRFLDSRGSVVKVSVPSQAYLNTLSACGFTPNLTSTSDLVPVSVLRCSGVLDFSQSKAIRTRVQAIVNKARARCGKTVQGIRIADLSRKLAQVDFGISPFGVFFSDLDTPGSRRIGGINVAETRLVILNAPFWEQMRTSSDLDSMLVHEALEALGIDDSQYEISARIYLIAKEGATGHDSGSSSGKKLAMSEGGASVVGRGGDPNAEVWKLSLLKLVEKKLVVDGVDPRFVPTKAELTKVINRTDFVMVPETALLQRHVCDDPVGGGSSRLTCGGFAFKDDRGLPLVIYSREWIGFSAVEKRPLLIKVYRMLIESLVFDKQGLMP